MTDFVWQPFVLRRTTHGDVLRSASTVQAALRYGPPTFAWDIVKGTTLTGRSQDYNALIIDVQVPPSVPNRGEMVLVRGGFVSRAGVVSASIRVQAPPGQRDQYLTAFARSMHYQFRAMFTPPGRTRSGARMPSPVWLHLEWRGSRRGTTWGVVRIGPQSARPWISGQESYIDNPDLRYIGAGAI